MTIVSNVGNAALEEPDDDRRPSEATAAREAGSFGEAPEAAGGVGGEVLTAMGVVNETATWLQGYKWTHFVTLTFHGAVTRKSALRYFRAWMSRLQFGSVSHPFVVAVEGSDFGFTPTHLHALVAVPKPFNCRLLENAWPHGWARARIYDRSKGGAGYVIKQIVGPDPEWDISSTLPEEY